ncbi:MAG: hypothetical protein ACAH80_17725 [Alphaproteobacteria bacterium]
MRTLAAILVLLLFALPAQAEEKDSLTIGLVRHLEYSETGTTAKLISRRSGMNGFEILILNFTDTTTAAFKACKPLLAKPLPDNRGMVVTGKGTMTRHTNDRIENTFAYTISEISSCKPGEDYDFAPNSYEALSFLPVIRGVENFPSIVAPPKEPTTPEQDWARFLEQGAELRSIDKFEWNRAYATLKGGGEVSIDNDRRGSNVSGGIEIIFSNLQDPLLKSCKALMEEPVNTASMLSVFGYGTNDDRTDFNAPMTLRLNKLIECKLVPAFDPAKQAAMNTPSSNLWVASMKAGGTTFWLHYTGARAQALEKTQAMDRANSYGGPGGEMSAAEAWLRRMQVKTAKPMRLGNLELTVEGDAKAGAAKVKQYADGGSNEHIYMLAHLYFHGVGVEKNQKAAYDLLRSVGPGGSAGGIDMNPWVNSYAGMDAEAAAAALTFDSNGKRRKVEFKMPGEPGAPVMPYGYQPFPGNEPEPMMEAPPFMMAPMEESLTLYTTPYPEE